jgi:hypothetical protein
LKKITTSQQNVLERLIFIESYEDLLSETGLQRGELRDDLTQLINSGMIEVFNKNEIKRLNGYDTDNLHYFSFRATSSGLKALKL